jgi:hypothetical protein
MSRYSIKLWTLCDALDAICSAIGPAANHWEETGKPWIPLCYRFEKPAQHILYNDEMWQVKEVMHPLSRRIVRQNKKLTCF